MSLKSYIKPFCYTILALTTNFFMAKGKKVQLTKIKNVLIVHFGLTGDVLMTTPLIETMRETLPNSAHITLLLPPCSYSAVEHNPNIDNLITYNAFWADPSDNHRHTVKFRHYIASVKLICKLRKTEYDLVINSWVMDQPLTPFLVKFCRYKNMIGFDFKYSKKFYDESFYFNINSHFADNILSMYKLYFNLNIDTSSKRLSYYMPKNIMTDTFNKIIATINKPYLVISPFSSERSKEWDLINWIEVTKFISNNYPKFSIVLTGLSKSKTQAEQLCNDSNVAVIDTVGKLSLEQFAFITSNAAALITIDSGSVHISSAVNVPVFVLFGQIYNYKQVLPYRVKFDYSVVDVNCAGCIYGCSEMSCMKHDLLKVIDKLNLFLRDMDSGGIIK